MKTKTARRFLNRNKWKAIVLKDKKNSFTKRLEKRIETIEKSKQ